MRSKLGELLDADAIDSSAAVWYTSKNEEVIKMKKRLTLFFTVLIPIILLFPLGCKSKKETEASPAEMAQAGDLKVTYASPKGSTEAPHEYDSLVVIFDHPIIPLEALSEGRGSELIQLEPSFAGKYRWLNPKTLSFTPDKIFPFATEIRATIPAGTKALDGFILKENFSWTFQTLRPRLLQHFPRHRPARRKRDRISSRIHFASPAKRKTPPGFPVHRGNSRRPSWQAGNSGPGKTRHVPF